MHMCNTDLHVVVHVTSLIFKPTEQSSGQGNHACWQAFNDRSPYTANITRSLRYSNIGQVTKLAAQPTHVYLMMCWPSDT